MQFEDEIKELTTLIWDSMLHLAIEPDGSPLPVGVRTMSASIHITGDWQGAVALSCGEQIAAQAAAVMFDLGDAKPAKSDMQDALGELVNVIGGNIKALLPGSCHLSLPAVVDGSDFCVRVPGSRLLTFVPFNSSVGMLSVSLLQSEEQAAQQAAGNLVSMCKGS
jgi:CheY-specific phosphatase CheX